MAEEYLTDDEQMEAIKRGIAENGVWVVGGVVLGAVLLFGWRFYHSHQNEFALKAAAQFGQMTAALESNDRNKARQVADGIIKDFASSPYADQAQLILARLYVDDGQLANANPLLTRVMKESKDSELKHIARLRLARVLTDEGKPDEAIKTLGEVAPGAFAARYHEVRGDAFYAKKDFKSAATEYAAALGAGDGSSVDSALLELKIADLSAPSAPATAMVPASAMAPTPSAIAKVPSSNKAKP
jgi:predicted negative regulator of RcsB-dependent stress response